MDKKTIKGPFEVKATPQPADEVSQKVGCMRMTFDKKFSGGTIKFVLLTAPGNAKVSTAVTLEDIRESIEHLRKSTQL